MASAAISVQRIVSVFALMRPVSVTIPVMSAQAMESVFVLIPDIFPVPISVINVSTFDLIAVTSVQLIVSVFVLTAERTAAVASGDTALVY